MAVRLRLDPSTAWQESLDILRRESIFEIRLASPLFTYRDSYRTDVHLRFGKIAEYPGRARAKETFMNVFAFSECENILTNKCNGEVKILMQAAERFGIMEEETRKRIEEICLHCRNRSSLEENVVNAGENGYAYAGRFPVRKGGGQSLRRTRFKAR